jgi:hypothetical protein
LTRAILAGTLAFGASLTFGVPSASAQGTGLGGYGTMVGGLGMGGVGSSPMGGGTMEPFAGRFGASMPSGMGMGGGVSFRSRPTEMMNASRASFTIGPRGGGMSGGMGLGSGGRPFVLQDLGGSAGMGLGGGMKRMPGTGVMPPNFGSPFRQPPSLLGPSASGPGMSM